MAKKKQRATLFDSIDELEADLEKSGGGLVSRPTAGDTEVRFMSEPNEWIGFKERWNEQQGRPEIMDDDASGRGISKKYLAEVVLVEADKTRSVAMKLPVSLAKKIFKKYKRNGTLKDRNYILNREGEGMGVEYDCEACEKSDFKYKKVTDRADIAEVFDALDSDDDDD